MVQTAAVVTRIQEPSQPVARAPINQRPGWVHELIVTVLAAANIALSPEEVLRRAEHSLGRRVAPSSIRNHLRRASSLPDAEVERVSYGRYRLRRDVPP